MWQQRSDFLRALCFRRTDCHWRRPVSAHAAALAPRRCCALRTRCRPLHRRSHGKRGSVPYRVGVPWRIPSAVQRPRCLSDSACGCPSLATACVSAREFWRCAWRASSVVCVRGCVGAWRASVACVTCVRVQWEDGRCTTSIRREFAVELFPILLAQSEPPPVLPITHLQRPNAPVHD